MVEKKNKTVRTKKLFVCFMLIAAMLMSSVNVQGVIQAYADTYLIKGREGEYGLVHYGLSLEYAGKIPYFIVNNGKIIDVNQTFSFSLKVPETMEIRAYQPYFFLMPYTDENILESFGKAYEETFYNFTANSLYAVNTGRHSLVGYAQKLVEYSSEDASLYSYVAGDGAYDPSDELLPPSGDYLLIGYFTGVDVINFGLSATKDSVMPATLVVAEKKVRISNPADGGYVGEEEEIEYIDLNVDVYVGDEKEKKANVVVYNEDGSTCYGTTPCKVVEGETVLLSITPGAENKKLLYYYDFPSLKAGDPYVVTVPANGYVEVDILPFTIGADMSGKVMDLSGNPVAGATVSITMTTRGDLSKSVVTTEDGSYQLSGIYAVDDIEITASKPGYLSVSETISASDLNSAEEILHDFSLEPKQTAFKLNFISDVEEAALGVFIMRLVKSDAITVENLWGQRIDGEFRWENGHTLAFTPDSADGIVDRYCVFINSTEVETESFTVDLYEATELKLKPLSFVKAEISYEENKYAGWNVYVFDSEEEVVGFWHGDSHVIQEVFESSSEEQDYTIAVFGTREPWSKNVSDLQELKRLTGERLYLKNVSACSGTVLDLGGIAVPVVSEEASELSALSYVDVPASIAAIGESLSISGHIEAGKAGELILNGIRIYGYAKGSNKSYSLHTAEYTENSLVVGGKVVKATSDGNPVEPLLMLEQKVTGPVDFSCKLTTLSASDMVISVAADVTIDGTEYKNQKIGEYYVVGQPVTIKTYTKTASGKIKCSGIAAAGETVNVWDKETKVGTTTADQYGTWEILVDLPVGNGVSRVHSLHATCNGSSSGEVIVMYEPNNATVEEIYMTQKGARLSNTYVWTQNSSFGFAAIVENPDSLEGEQSFSVLCSDGTLLELEAYPGEYVRKTNGIQRQIYYTNEEPFGEKNLVPSKIWFNYDSKAAEADQVTSISIHAGYRVTEEQLSAFGSRIEAEVGDGLLLQEDVSEYANIVTLTEESSAEEVKKLLEQGADFARICDDDGEILYETYSLYEGQTFWLGYYDRKNDSYYLVTTYYFTKEDYPEELKRLDQTTVYALGDFESDGYKRDVGKTFIRTGADIVVPDMLNEIVQALLKSNPKTAGLAGVTDYFGVSELYDMYKIGDDAIDFNGKRSTAIDEFNLLTFMSIAGEQVGKDVDTRRLNNSIANAQFDLNETMAMHGSYMAQSIMTSVANYSMSKSHPTVAAIVSMTKLISGPMLDEVKSHCQSSWAYAQQSVTEAKRDFLRTTGMSHDQLIQMYDDYIHGKISLYDIKKKIEKSMKEKEEKKAEESEDAEEVNGVIDPSGFVYEAVASNRLEGATVTLYGEGMQLFEAEAYKQNNPLTTDSDGKYAWDVPEGNWFVKAYLAGYEEGTSQNDPAAVVTIDGVNYLPVLPPQLDVNIGLTSLVKPKASLEYKNGSWYLLFDRYVDVTTVTRENIAISCKQLVVGESNANYSFEAVDAEVSPAHTPICGGKTLARDYRIVFAPSVTVPSEEALTVKLGSQVLGYNGLAATATLHVNGGYQEETTGNDTEIGTTDSSGNAQQEEGTKPTQDKHETEDKADEAGSSTGLIVGIIVGVVVLLIGIVAVVIVKKNRKKK